MVVCLCNAITEEQLKNSINKGSRSVKELRNELGMGENCGCCAAFTKKYIENHQLDEQINTVQA